jgi:hypothetical protein
MLSSASPRSSTKVLRALIHQLCLLSGAVDPSLGSERARIFTKDFFVVMRNHRVATYLPAAWNMGSSQDNALCWE